MPRTLPLIFIAIFLLTACRQVPAGGAPAPALPTKPPTNTPIPPTETPTHTPVPTNTPTPTLEPWMQSLPIPDLEVRADENGNINAYDGEALVYSWDGSEWVEYSPYNIVREAAKESQMSTVDWVQRENGTWGLDEHLMDWLRRNPLPTRHAEPTDFDFGNIPSLGDSFSFAQRMETWTKDNNPRLHSIHIISAEDVQNMGAEVAERGFLYVYQFDQDGKDPQFMQVFVNGPKHEEMKEKNVIERGGPMMPFSEMTTTAIDRFYPRGSASGRVYDNLVRNIYKLQLGPDGEKLVEQWLTMAAEEDRFPDELEGIILIGGGWIVW